MKKLLKKTAISSRFSILQPQTKVSDFDLLMPNAAASRTVVSLILATDQTELHLVQFNRKILITIQIWLKLNKIQKIFASTFPENNQTTVQSNWNGGSNFNGLSGSLFCLIILAIRFGGYLLQKLRREAIWGPKSADLYNYHCFIIINIL